MDWMKTIRAVAPSLVRMIGGPFGGVAEGILKSVLGVPADAPQDALETKVASLTADDLKALKAAEQQFVKDMKALDIDVLRIDAEDRDSARKREMTVKDRVPSVLAFVLITAFVALLFVLLKVKIPTENRDIFTIMLTLLSASVGSVFGYYFGSSQASRTKDATIQTAVETAAK